MCQCAARSKRSGIRCQKPTFNGKRVCYFHGGASTGPNTKEGLENSKKARLKHGRYSKEILERQRQSMALIRDCKNLLRLIGDGF